VRRFYNVSVHQPFACFYVIRVASYVLVGSDCWSFLYMVFSFILPDFRRNISLDVHCATCGFSNLMEVHPLH